MNENQIKAISWIKSGMEYTSGVDLLVDLTRKQTYYNLFTGKDKVLPDRLAYEICNAAYIKAGSELSKMIQKSWYWQLPRHKKRLTIS